MSSCSQLAPASLPRAELAVLVFARMSATRLPGKMLMDFGGMPLYRWVTTRAQALGYPVYLCTSTDTSDDALSADAARTGLPCFRGALHDVRGRALAAAAHFGLVAFARLCGDRPFFSVSELRAASEILLADATLDLVSNTIAPQAAPAGLTTEVMRVESLRRAQNLSASAPDQEHVTRTFYQHPEKFRLALLPAARSPFPDAALQAFAVDTEADLVRLRALLQ